MREVKDVQKRIESIEGLIREIDNVSDPAVVSLSKQLVQSLMDLHGSAIERMLEIVHATDGNGQTIIDEMGRDDLVSSLLLLYGLHPLDLHTRIATALKSVRPYLRSHGGSVELVRISESGAVTIRLDGSFDSLASTVADLKSRVERAIYEAAPDIAALAFEGTLQNSVTVAAFVPLTRLQGNGTAHDSHTASNVPEINVPESKRLEGSAL